MKANRYSDINPQCGVLTKGKRTLRGSAHASLCHYHLADIPASSDVLQQLCTTHKAIRGNMLNTCIQCTTQVNLNITSVSIYIMHVIMHACNMYVAAHGNYGSRTALCLTLTHVLYTLRVAKLHLCACAHPITRVLPCAAHTQRIATALF